MTKNAHSQNYLINKLMKETVKIKLNKDGLNFSDREKFFNTEIQKTIDLYNSRGFIVIEHNVLNKTSLYCSVEFVIKQMVK
jgi:hypothetical protein